MKVLQIYVFTVGDLLLIQTSERGFIEKSGHIYFPR